HAAYNALVKTSRDKVLFYWSMYAAASAIILLTALWLPTEFTVPDRPVIWVHAFLAASFYTLYHLATGVAYSADGGDLSLSYPLSTTGPLYIPLLAYLFLGEIASSQTLIGIGVVFAGAFLIQLRRSGVAKIRRTLRIDGRAARYALLAGFLYSFGAVVDKQGVIASNFFVFTSYVIVFMFLMLTAATLTDPNRRARCLEVLRTTPGTALCGGFLLYGSFYLYRYGLEISDVSQAASIRQVGALFGVLIGVRMLGEPYGLLRLVAAGVIVMGVVLIKTG
ncbi:MAG: EamA family transporter, partial [candidate division Zixibacteria bacterium]|nr:EamA family transporter [candidate division Zixibacteria bacterium]